MSKKLQEKQQRRLAEERRRQEQQQAARRRNLVTIGIAVVVLGLVVGSIYYQRREEDRRLENVGVPASQAGCEQIERPEEQGREHIEEGAPHEPYSSSPPTSGPHYATPAQVDFYSSALPPEQLVHNLEHGQIVIWYRPDAPQDTIDAIEALVEQEPAATVASQYEDIEQPYTFALTGWGGLQRCTRVSQEVVDDFRREFQGKGPEALTPPFEG